MGSDQFDVLDIAETAANDLKSLADDINLQQTDAIDLQAQVDSITHNLESIDEKVVNVRNGINFQVIIPTRFLTLGLFTNQYGRIGGLTNYNKNDKTRLEESIDLKSLSLADLQSTANGIGYSIAEAGIILSYPALTHRNYQLSIGTKIKYQRIDLFYNQLNISEFDDNDFDLDNDKYLTDKSAANIDLGLHISWGDNHQWHAALVTNNLVSQEVQHSEQDLMFRLKATTAIGFSYQNDWLILSTEFDVTDREHFLSLMPSKYASIGAEYKFSNQTQFRLGLRSDLNDVDGDLYTIGLGVSPWDIFTVDLAAFAGNNDTIGAAIQFGFKV
jgi:hypothetical protein